MNNKSTHWWTNWSTTKWRLKKVSYNDFIKKFMNFYRLNKNLTYYNGMKVMTFVRLSAYTGIYSTLSVYTYTIPNMKVCSYDLISEYDKYIRGNLSVEDVLFRINDEIKDHILHYKPKYEHYSDIKSFNDIFDVEHEKEFYQRIDKTLEEYQYPVYRVNDLFIINLRERIYKLNLIDCYFLGYLITDTSPEDIVDMVSFVIFALYREICIRGYNENKME